MPEGNQDKEICWNHVAKIKKVKVTMFCQGRRKWSYKLFTLYKMGKGRETYNCFLLLQKQDWKQIGGHYKKVHFRSSEHINFRERKITPAVEFIDSGSRNYFLGMLELAMPLARVDTVQSMFAFSSDIISKLSFWWF